MTIAQAYLRLAPVASHLEERLSRALKRLRARSGWTQEHAAAEVGVNPRHYQKLEEGSVNATLRTLDRLSDAFDVDVRQLFPRA